MRTIALALAALLTAPGPASALDDGETMKAWATASPGDRSALLGRMLGKGASGPSGILVRRCVDEASAISGHASLTIKDVVTACKASKSNGEPV